LSGYLERVSLVTDVDALKDQESVTLMTVHGAKGLEFATVIVTGMEDETFPYRGLDGDHPDELDEERRLAYVAVTRARHRLFLLHAGIRTLFGQTKYLCRSRFLEDLPEDAVIVEGSLPRAARFESRFGSGRFVDPYARRPPPTDRMVSAVETGRVVDYDAFDDTAEERNVRPGDRVVHARFGRGVVESIQVGAPPTIVARFPGWGSRKVRADFLNFER
jgi:DNA helicase-2/ATP-dependent DNA helicase PcrA